MWALNRPADCAAGCTLADALPSADACGGHASSARQLTDPATNTPECLCDCDQDWTGIACERPLTKTLVLAPAAAFAVAGGIGVFAVATIRAFRCAPKLQWDGTIVTMEVLDSVLDVLTFSLTWLTGGFTFDNDPGYLLAWAIGAVAVLTIIAFAVEMAWFELHRGGGASLSQTQQALYFLVLHIIVEDGVQLVLYAIASASQTSELALVAIGIGILQGLIFFIMKTRELLQYDGARVYQGLGAEYNA